MRKKTLPQISSDHSLAQGSGLNYTVVSLPTVNCYKQGKADA